MWNFDSDNNKWNKSIESLNKDNYDFIRQELDKIRYYSKCIDGTSYLSINNFDNIYDDSIGYITNDTWFIEGIDKLLELADQQTTAIMCSEEDPAK